MGVTTSSVIRWCERHRSTGGAAAGQIGGHRALVLLAQRDWVLARLAAAPDMTLRGLVAELAEQGISASYGSVWRLLAAEGLTFLAALRSERIDAPCIIDGPINGPINGTIFQAWVEQFLGPTLRPGDVVVLDDLGSHKGQAVRRAIRAAGAHMLFLPPCSTAFHQTNAATTSATQGMPQPKRIMLYLPADS